MSAERGARNAEPQESSALRAPRSGFLPTDRWVHLLLAPALLFIACGIDRNYQTDLWHHLARGRIMTEEGRILDEDRFTYTLPGQPLLDVNWLTQLFVYQLFRLGGLPLLQAVNALALAVTLGVLVVLCRRRSGSSLVACGLGLFVFLGMWQLILIRPQTFSLLFFVLLYAILEGTERRPGLLVLAPLLMALWVNVHGAFPIGVVLIGCYLLAALVEAVWSQRWQAWRDWRVRVLAATLVASALATLVNPYGWRVYEYVARTSGLATARKIDEWLPPGSGLLIGKVWVASLAGMLVLFALPGRRPTVQDVILVLVFLPLACGSVRMVAWWLLVVAPIAAALLADRLPRDKLERPDLDRPNPGAALVCGLLLAGCLVSLPALERFNPLFPRLRSPHRVEDDLQDMAVFLSKKASGGRVFTRFEWSEYVGWALAPRFTVFMDGRIEIFPDAVWDDYSAVTGGHASWQAILDRHEVDFLLVDAGPYHGRLLPLVEAAKDDWRVLHTTGRMTLYRRTPRAGP